MAGTSSENDPEKRSRKSRHLEVSPNSDITRRVLAPFLSRHRRRLKLKLTDVKEESRYVYQEAKSGEALAKLSQFFQDSVDHLPMVLNETSEIMKCFTKSDGVSLYMVDPSNEYIVLNQKHVPKSDRYIVRYPIEPGTTVAAYVAYVQELVAAEDILGDPRFPQGIPGAGKTVKSVLCLPVLTCSEDVLAVIELYKDIHNQAYSLIDQEMAVTVTGWMGAAIHQNNEKLSLEKEIELIKYFLNLLQLFFSRVIPFDKFVSDIVIFAKTTIGAERGYFYHLTDPVVEGTEEDILTEVYEEGIGPPNQCYKKKTLQRFCLNAPGLAGYVARSGQSIILEDAYQDPRFNRESDTLGFRSRSVIAVPVKSSLHVLGVLKLTNKLPPFTERDEQILQIFASFSLLASQFEKAFADLRKTVCRYELNKELIFLYIKPCPDDMEALVSSPVLKTSEMPKGYFGFDWFLGEQDKYSPNYVLFSIVNCLGSDYFDHSSLSEFILMVKKSYRANPYHNFLHAFTVFHCVFNIINKNRQIFTTIEKAALLIATLCHDVDHLGYTNSFLGMTEHWLADLYEQSSLEHHHFDMCMMLLEITDLFSKLTTGEFQQVKSLIEYLILSTDLATHFKIRSFITNTVRTGTFDWSNSEHRETFMSVIMTSCDISGQCKPFPIAKYSAECLYREFYIQGDEEKKRGVTPLAMMDRNQTNLIPMDQIHFLTIICIPCLEVLVSVLPNTEPLLKLCMKVKDSWKMIKQQQDKNLWWPEESLVLSAKPSAHSSSRQKIGSEKPK